MIAVDTNIVVRLLTQDDEVQFRKSKELFKTQDIFISDTVILQTEWVLRFAYRLTSSDICIALRNLFGLPNVFLTNASLISQILQWYESELDFADAFHLAQGQYCPELYTFDQKFVKRAAGLTKCVVKQL